MDEMKNMEMKNANEIWNTRILTHVAYSSVPTVGQQLWKTAWQYL